jgi:hypothetical protein
MSSVVAGLTAEQILALAPDGGAARAGRELASARRWTGLGRSAEAAWGECRGSAKLPYQAAIDLGGPAFRCSCPSRKFPCKHGLGLFLLLASQPAAFAESAPPSWIGDWLASRAQRAARPARAERADTPADPAAQARRSARREAQVAAGLADLARWLRDLVRQGLGAAQRQPSAFWERPAARLVDAQAPGAARLVRELAVVPSSGPGWQERLLDRVASLHLLVEAYRRIEQLPPATQEDVRVLLGWTQPQETLLAAEGVGDRWAVLGQRTEDDGRLRTRRTWLWGCATGREALVLHFAPPGAALAPDLVVGRVVEAELVYYPGARPLRALVKRQAGLSRLDGPPEGQTLADGLGRYAEALGLNPWIEQFPLLCRAVVPARHGEEWLVRDREGRALPLTPRFGQGWRLLALSGGEPLTLFGEWDGERLLPLSAWAEGRLCGF